MDFKNNLSISICSADDINSKIIKALLNRKGFNSVDIITCIEDLVVMLKQEGPSFTGLIILDSCLKNDEHYKLATITYLKEHYSELIIVCMSGINEITKISPLKALNAGCDSWVDKDNTNYIDELLKTIDNWASYIKKRTELKHLYNNILNSEDSTFIM